MKRRQSFRRKIFLSYFSIFVLFTVMILAFQYKREKSIRIAALDNRLNDLSGLVDNFITAGSVDETGNYRLLDSLAHLMPLPDLRITVIDVEGKVIYDSSVNDWSAMDNHLSRPEVGKSLFSDYGTAIRKSASTGKDYYYFSRYFGKYYVRLAEEYNINVRDFLRREKIFLAFMVLIFMGTWALLALATRRLGESITMLRDFAARVRRGEGNDTSIVFPKNEIGETGKEIVKIYESLSQRTAELATERERLFRHLHVLNEGVAFFSSERKVILSNNHFLVFVNMITGEHSIEAVSILDHPLFAGVRSFIDSHQASSPHTAETPSPEFNVEKGGRHFGIRCIIFHDCSFEIVITDITRTEQTKALRQQMTSNIAHELRTPTASVRGYLETLIMNPDLPDDKKNYFLSKALTQSERLTELIDDIVTLNRIDESAGSFVFEVVNVSEVISGVCESLAGALSQSGMTVEQDFDKTLSVTANRSLVISIFQNLLENAVSYAGQGVKVRITSLPAEPGFRKFSFSDNGVGIPEEHQSRIFERFYRVDDGRSRKSGGTGLGLAIVKNAVLLHRGEISVRTRTGGGTEFIFSLPE